MSLFQISSQLLNVVNFWLSCPVINPLQKNSAPVGALLLVADPHKFLYPIVSK